MIMGVDIKAVQAKARLAMGGKMDFSERSAWGFRLARIGNPFWPYKDECSYDEAHTPKLERITIHTHLVIDKKTLELQQRIVTLEEEFKKLRPTVKERYKY